VTSDRSPVFCYVEPLRDIFNGEQRFSERHLLDHCGESHRCLRSCDGGFATIARDCFQPLAEWSFRPILPIYRVIINSYHPTEIARRKRGNGPAKSFKD
jgi:hypothetical protein